MSWTDSIPQSPPPPPPLNGGGSTVDGTDRVFSTGVVGIPEEEDDWTGEGPGPVILALAIPKQDQDNWCWAAVAVGIDAAYGTAGRTQCTVASAVIGIECCPNGSRAGRVGACDEPRTLPPALGPHFLEELTGDEYRKFTFVKGEIDDGHPVAVRLATVGAEAGHFVVIAGYSVTNGAVNLHVWDPSTGSASDERFDEFRANFRQFGTWERSYSTKGTDQGRQRVPRVGAGNSRRTR